MHRASSSTGSRWADAACTMLATSDLLLVASEPSALLAHPLVSSAPDDRWLTQYFALSRPTDNRTPFRDIRKLLPGECLVCTPDGMRLTREPLALGRRPLRYRREADYAEHFRALLDQAVGRSLIDSGERTGIMLSGGMDSGPVAALAQRRLSAAGRTLTAYSWSLPEYPSADETAEIAACAGHIGCGLQLLPGADEWPLRDLRELAGESQFARCERLPPSQARGLPCRGQGRLPCHIERRLRRQPLSAPRPSLDGRVAGRTPRVRAARDRPDGWHLRADRPLARPRPAGARQASAGLARPDPLGARLAHRQRHGSIGTRRAALGRRNRPITRVPTTYQAALDQWAADGLSEEVFFASRCGIDRRDPFRDADLIDFMLSIPSYVCYRDGHTKWLARESMRGLLPESIRLRPRGGLLTEFFDAGYRRELPSLRRLLTARDVAWPAYVDHGWLMRALDAREPSEKEKLLVWYCAAFELWRQALSGEHPELLQFAQGQA